MNNLIKYPARERGTLCFKNNCVTVYDETAQIVKAIAVIAVVVSSIALIAKTLK
jgi:hypothetical protein